MKRIYLSGPMTGLPEFNFPAFHAAAARLRQRGYEVANPAKEIRMYDVIAVSIHNHRVRILCKNKTEKNANAIVLMALERNGIEEEYYTEAPAGKYRDGDVWKPTPLP